MVPDLTPKQFRAIQLLATGEKNINVARILNMRRETLSRWKRKPEFTKEMERVMRDTHECMRYRLVQLAEVSVTAVCKEVTDGGGDPKRIIAALNVLKLLGMERLVSLEDEEGEATTSAY